MSSLLLTVCLALAALSAAVRAAPLQPRVIRTQSTYMNYAISAANRLNSNWFDTTNGLWQSDWWNSANIVTTIADLTAIDNQILPIVKEQFALIFDKAQASNGGSWHNDYYDDEGWWAMAWIKAWDVTKNDQYLSAAQDIFEDLLTGLGAPCGGQWWDKQHTGVNSINNALFIAVAASLANRVSDAAECSTYKDFATKQADWFINANLLTSNNTIHDGLSFSTDCSAEGQIWTYNQGVILGAFAELSKFSSTPSKYLDFAAKVADGAIKTLVDDNGVLTEWAGYPTTGPTASQFKGVFARNLRALHYVRPDNAYVQFLQTNAVSIWEKNRDDVMQLGPDWQGPVTDVLAPAQSSALDCLVAAAAVMG